MNNPLRSLFYIVTTLLSTAFFASGQQSYITQVKDINQSALSASSLDDSMVNVNGTLFLATDDELTGSELWKLPPGGNAFQFITDLAPGPDSSLPENLTAIGGKLYFSADAGGAGRRDLWVSDGTEAGTLKLADLDDSTQFTPFLGALFFDGNNVNSGMGSELWKSDLTAAGTSLFKNIAPGSADSFLGNFKVVGGTTLFFTAENGGGQALWKTDGTANGTVLVKDPIPNANLEQFSLFTDVGGTLFFRARGSESGFELWKSDGTPDGTVIVTEIQLGSSSGGPQKLTSVNLTGVGPRLFFTAVDGLNGRELWISDGNDFNTHMVRDIRALDNSDDPATDPDNLTAMNGWLFFTANEITTGRELWRSDGTQGGTARVADLVPGLTGSDPANLIDVNGTLFFTTSSGNNLKLWKMTFAIVNDQFTPTTTLVKDLPETPDTATTAISNLVVNGDKLFFKLNDDEIWQSDGTEAGTFQIQRFRNGTGGSMPGEFALVGNEAYFAATDANVGREFWKTDGTTAGTVLVSNISAGGDSNPTGFTPVGTPLGDFVFFSAAAAGLHRELYVQDNTGSVFQVADINEQASKGSDPDNLTKFNNMLFFAATEQHPSPGRTSGRELWRSDPVEGVTELVKDIQPGTGSSSPSNFRVAGNYLFFTAADPNGNEVWRTDGTDAGTIMLKNIAEGPGAGSAPSNLVTLDKSVIFAASDGASKGRELWKSDGTTAGTVMVKDIRTGSAGSLPTQAYLTPVEKLKLVFFVANDGKTGLELWKSNGTDAGTTLVKDINPIVNGSVNQPSTPTQLVAVGDKLFFVATDGVNGRELWRTDGTAAGTFMVKNITANGDSDIREITDVNGLACFSFDNGVNGRELWVSDGTAAGTFLVPQDLTGDDSSSIPNELFAFKSGLLFAATTRADGTELFFAAVGPEIGVEQPVGTGLVNGATVNFGAAVAVPASTTLSFRIKNTGINNLTGVAATITGQHAAEYTITTKPAATVAQNGGFTDMEVKFAPREDGVRNAVLRIASNDGDENPFEIILQGTGDKDPAITTQPISQMVQVGQPVAFAAAAATVDPGGMTVKWLKNKGAIPGAIGNNYNIASAKLTDAGAFTFQAQNSLKVIATSDIAELGVVEDQNPPKLLVGKAGATVTMLAKAAGNGLIYLWRKNGAALPVDPRITGGNTKTLQIKNIAATDTALYTCEVSGPWGGMAVGGSTELRVFDKPPQIDNTVVLPRGIVGAVYNPSGPGFPLPMINPNFERTPLTFSASVLPPGMKIDSKTGVVSGIPTKSGTFAVKFTAGNGILPNSVLTVQLVVDAIPAGSVGVFAGVIPRSAITLGSLGGRFDLTVAAAGGFTGKVTLGLVSHPISGKLNVVARATANDVIAKPTGAFTINRKGQNSLNGTFEMDYAANRISIASLSEANTSNTQAFTAWRNVWDTKLVTLANCTTVTGSKTVGCASTASLKEGMNVVGTGIPLGATVTAITNLTTFELSVNATATTPPTPPASTLKLTADFAARAYEGPYTFGLDAPAGVPDIPMGYGFGYFTVMKTGLLTGTVKTPDGESATWSTFVSDAGELLCFQVVYTPKGSIVGTLDIDPLDLQNANDNTIGGALSLVRPANPAPSARIYEAGHGPNDWTAFGSRWVNPVAPNMILGLVEPGGTDNAHLIFEDGGLTDPAAQVNVTFDVGPKSKITMPASGVDNPGGVKLSMTLSAATGLISGSFVLEDDELRTGPTFVNKKFKRTGTISGILTQDGAGPFGACWFKLEELPTDTVAPANTDINFGSVRVEKK